MIRAQKLNYTVLLMSTKLVEYFRGQLVKCYNEQRANNEKTRASVYIALLGEPKAPILCFRHCGAWVY